jgi:hypothetical protein
MQVHLRYAMQFATQMCDVVKIQIKSALFASSECEQRWHGARDARAGARNFARDGIVVAPTGTTKFFSQVTAQTGCRGAESIKKCRIGAG